MHAGRVGRALTGTGGAKFASGGCTLGLLIARVYRGVTAKVRTPRTNYRVSVVNMVDERSIRPLADVYFIIGDGSI